MPFRRTYYFSCTPGPGKFFHNPDAADCGRFGGGSRGRARRNAPDIHALIECFLRSARLHRGALWEITMANAGIVGLDWQQRINWDRLRKYRLERARERMKAHGLGAMLLMYDENVRYVTGTLTPGWNRLKPGLRYALLCGDDAPVLFEQGDIGLHIQKHSPWIPKENIRYSYAWIKGAAGPASTQQVTKFTNAIKQEMKKRGVDGMTLGVDFIDINMIKIFDEAKIKWADGMTPM